MACMISNAVDLDTASMRWISRALIHSLRAARRTLRPAK
jgi:hypothetical protein